jgi:hypothetical protein
LPSQAKVLAKTLLRLRIQRLVEAQRLGGLQEPRHLELRESACERGDVLQFLEIARTEGHTGSGRPRAIWRNARGLDTARQSLANR